VLAGGGEHRFGQRGWPGRKIEQACHCGGLVVKEIDGCRRCRVQQL
jgi:hypothetical protein